MNDHGCLVLKLENGRTGQDNKLQNRFYVFSFILLKDTSRFLSNKIPQALNISSCLSLISVISIQKICKKLHIIFKYIKTNYMTYLHPQLSDQQTDLISFWIPKVPFGCLNIDRWAIMCLGSIMKNLSEGWTSTSFDARCGYVVNGARLLSESDRSWWTWTNKNVCII